MTLPATVDVARTGTETPDNNRLDWAEMGTTSLGREQTRGRWALSLSHGQQSAQIADNSEGNGSGTDFWSRLSTIELDALMSGRGATNDLPIGRRPVRSQIAERDLEARALLTTAVRRLAPILHAIIASKASRAGLKIREAYFDVDRDDEEDSRQLTMIVRVDANAAQALAFWNSLDYELDRWLAQLSKGEQEVLTNRLGLRFVWDGSSGR